MRNPAPRVLLVAMVVIALTAGIGAPVAGDAALTTPSPSLDPHTADGSASIPTSTTSVAPASTSASTATQARSSAAVGLVQQIDGEFDSNTKTQIRIELSPDRDARWEVSVRYELTDAGERSAFETVAERFLAGEIGPDTTMFEGFAREASRNVDRTMQIENADRDAAVHEDPSSFEAAGDDAVAVGELRLTFVWTSFLAEDGENLVLGDALTTPNDGTWLVSLTEAQTIEVTTPGGYSVTGTPGSTAARLADGDVVIEGPQLFENDERVEVVYAPTGTVGPPWTMLAGAIILGALLIAGSIVGYRRIDDDRSVADDGGVETGTEPDASDSAASAASPGLDAASDADDEPEEDLSLLSDEERVERLLADSGGRMRQADIVAETGWSDAKVSQLLSSMTAAGRVEKLRLGRENLISLPDDESATNGESAANSGSAANGESAANSESAANDPDTPSDDR